jgi:glutamyl-tRNA synthetase
LYRFLGWENVMPEFAHLPLLLKPDGNGKLSKRDGDRLGFPVFPLNWVDPQTGETSSGYREKGYLPEAFVNMLALLGWHPSGDQELFTMQELIDDFSLERVSKAGAKFDPEKTKWFNQQYLRKHSDDDLAVTFMSDIKTMIGQGRITAGGDNPNFNFLAGNKEYIKAVVRIVRERIHLTNELWDHSWYFFLAPVSFDEAVITKRWNDKSKLFFTALSAAYRKAESFTVAEAENIFKKTIEDMGLKTGDVMQLFRVIITGISRGAELFDVIALLGKDEVVKRLDYAIINLDKK